MEVPGQHDDLVTFPKKSVLITIEQPIFIHKKETKMKRFTIYTTALLLGLSLSLQAQVNSERKTMSEGVYEAQVMQIPNMDAKAVGSLWEDFMKSNYNARTKYNRKTKEYFTDDASIAGIGQGNTIDIYTTVEDKSGGSELSMWINLGGAYLSRGVHGDRYLEAEKLLISFGLETAKESVRMDIKAQEKSLDDLMGELKKLDSDKSRLERDIEKAREAIAQAEKEIATNLTLQEAKQAEIKAQEELVDATKRKLKDL
jgi:hypothetical protein